MSIIQPLLKPSNNNVNLKEGLLSCWELDEISGTVVYDSHGINNGTNVGATINQTGIIGKCYSFYRAQIDRLTFGNILSFEKDQAFSINVWAKRTEISRSHALVTKAQFGGNNTGYGLELTASNELSFFLRANINNSIYVTGSSTIGSNSWAMFTVTYDGSSSAYGVNAYVNGYAESLSIVYDTLTSSIITTSQFCIGARNLTAIPFNGYMDNTLIYNRVLSQEDITALYNGGLGIAYINM